MIFHFADQSRVSKPDWQAISPTKFTHGNRKHCHLPLDQLDNLLLGNQSPKPLGHTKKHFQQMETIHKQQIFKPKMRLFSYKNHSNVNLSFDQTLSFNSYIQNGTKFQNKPRRLKNAAEYSMKSQNNSIVVEDSVLTYQHRKRLLN